MIFHHFFGTRFLRQGGNIQDRPFSHHAIENIPEESEISLSFNELPDDTSNLTRITNALNIRIDESIGRLGDYWSSIRRPMSQRVNSMKVQISNYCDEFKRKLLDNL